MFKGFPWKQTDYSSLLRLHPSTEILLLTMRDTSFLLRGFLPTVVDTMVIQIKFTHPVIFSSLIPKMLMFTLAVSCLTTSSLPGFMDLTFQVPMQLCCYSIGFYFCHQTIHNWASFPLWPSLFLLSGALPSSLLDTFWPGGSSFGVISFCLFLQFMGFSQLLYWSVSPFPPPVDHTWSERSTLTLPLGGPTQRGS